MISQSSFFIQVTPSGMSKRLCNYPALSLSLEATLDPVFNVNETGF